MAYFTDTFEGTTNCATKRRERIRFGLFAKITKQLAGAELSEEGLKEIAIAIEGTAAGGSMDGHYHAWIRPMSTDESRR
jgi:hypothetical protein